jgi:hypothetical protein
VLVATFVLVISATTDTLISRNHQTSAEARAAAEAGLSHALEVAIPSLGDWEVDGFASQSDAMTSMLRGPDDRTGSEADDADNGSLGALGIPDEGLTLGGMAHLRYTVRVLDEDDIRRGAVLGADDEARIGEDGDPAVDANARVVIRATGYAGRNAMAIVEATIAPASLPAVPAGQDLEIGGNATIDGPRGDIHANGALSIGGSVTVAGDATASISFTTSGHPSIDGGSGSGYAPRTVVPVRASDYLSKADFILTADGQLTNPGGAVLCDASAKATACVSAGYAWRYEGADGWAITGSSRPAPGTYYVEGAATISGSPGSAANPVQMSIIAEGNLSITGGPGIIPDSTELLFVTDGDLRITGALSVPLGFEGQILVREQIAISGNASIAGQILVEGAASASSLVTANTISGNATVIYSGVAGSGALMVSGWRRP